MSIRLLHSLRLPILRKLRQGKRKNDFVLPDQYKSWLMLTERSGILGGDIEFFTSLDGETGKYEDFDDLLTGLSGFPEDSAEEALGEEWGDIYDERFGE